MKKRLSLLALSINFILAFAFSAVAAPMLHASPLVMAAGITATYTAVTYFAPIVSAGSLMEGLQTEVWIPTIIDNPVPDNSFISESTDLSEWVDNNTINLVEAGVQPAVFENYFAGNENPLPLASITDIAHEVVLKTYSTEQTRHRSLQDVELSYDKQASLILRHKRSLELNLGVRAAFAWTPAVSNAFNKIFTLAPTDSIVDALIDAQAFMASLDKTMDLNVCFNGDHMARIRKEDKKLYKEILSENEMYGFKVHQFSKNPLFTAAGVKKPMGSVAADDDRRSSFIWAKDEAFRCFGDVKMYATLNSSEYQADTISFAQRALIGAIRAQNPKYFAAII